MTKIKTGFRPLFDKMVGTNLTPITEEEVELLMFMLRSDIIFDGTGQQYLPMLEALDKVMPLELTDEISQELVYQDSQRQEQDRQMQIRTVFLTAMKESMLQELKVRYGI
ncbi:hypothetical protein KQ941_03295 [Paenibacillus xylanexedens]|uniref:hypothetical protein n=1 Tax=Paenibacillus xylanexedens TaxID=528191 RepID=UPI001F373C19|nr:hypothetical protein [Paenibacillus xylanexedens]MCF7753456.1 hypothetical protein [Paenibacillus xylanexedens]